MERFVAGAVAAHGRGCFVDLGSLVVVELGHVCLGPLETLPDTGALLVGGGGVGPRPLATPSRVAMSPGDGPLSSRLRALPCAGLR
jgi:hypothetical protein